MPRVPPVRKVLVVEDDPLQNEMVQDVLKIDEGMEVLGAHTGAEGLRLCLGGDYQVVVLDWGLPDMSGAELLTWLRAHRPEVVVIILTGFSDDETLEEARTLGAADVLQKPCDIGYLRSRVRALANRADSLLRVPGVISVVSMAAFM